MKGGKRYVMCEEERKMSRKNFAGKNDQKCA